MKNRKKILIVGGSAFIGYIEPQPPLIGLMVVAMSPLALWSQWFVRARQDAWGKIIPAAALAVVIGVGMLLVVLA